MGRLCHNESAATKPPLSVKQQHIIKITSRQPRGPTVPQTWLAITSLVQSLQACTRVRRPVNYPEQTATQSRAGHIVDCIGGC